MADVLRPSAASELLSVCNCAWLASVLVDAAEVAAAGCCVVVTGATLMAVAVPFALAWTPPTATASVAAAGVVAPGAGVMGIVGIGICAVPSTSETNGG